MARKLRVEYPGAIYHVINRGDRREDIFLGDQDRELFLQTLQEGCAKTGWQVLAYCLMRNHFHLVLETPRANLVAGMKWFLGTYTARFNRRHKLFGHLFSGRYKSLIVDGSAQVYLRTVCDYVHLNPVRARLLTVAAPLSNFPWSSYPEYLKTTSKRCPWLKVERLLEAHGVPSDSPAGRKKFEMQMEARRGEGSDKDWKKVRRGWALGSEAFRQELLARMQGRAGQSHYGPELRESEEEKARRLITEEIAKLKSSRVDFNKMNKGDERKIKIAARLRRETSVPLRWIAEELKMGSIAYATRLLRERRNTRA